MRFHFLKVRTTPYSEIFWIFKGLIYIGIVENQIYGRGIEVLVKKRKNLYFSDKIAQQFKENYN